MSSVEGRKACYGILNRRRVLYCIPRVVKFMGKFVPVYMSYNHNLLCISLLLIAHSSGKKPFLRTKITDFGSAYNSIEHCYACIVCGFVSRRMSTSYTGSFLGKTLVAAGHVSRYIISARGGEGKYHITCFHIPRPSFVYKMADHIAFLCCLEFALLNSLYEEIILKPKQVLCLESVYLQKDVMCVLPTGYGKLLIFHLLLMLLFAKYKLRGDLIHAWRSKSFSTVAVNSIVIVVSPFNS